MVNGCRNFPPPLLPTPRESLISVYQTRNTTTRSPTVSSFLFLIFVPLILYISSPPGSLPEGKISHKNVTRDTLTVPKPSSREETWFKSVGVQSSRSYNLRTKGSQYELTYKIQVVRENRRYTNTGSTISQTVPGLTFFTSSTCHV